MAEENEEVKEASSENTQAIPNENIQKTLKHWTIGSKEIDTNLWSFPYGLNPLDNSRKVTEIIDIDKYWNFNNVSNPRADVEFLEEIDSNGQAKWININQNNDVRVNLFSGRGKTSATNNNNYIVSMNITDNGVKELELVLYDRNFTDLQKLITNAIQKINSKTEELKKEELEKEEKAVINNGSVSIEFLTTPQKVTSNIRVRYGYNEDLNSKVGKDYTGLGVINNQSEKYYRWRSSTSGENINELEEGNTQEDLQDISSDTVLSHHYQQSTVLSEWEEFFIVGLTTNLTESGIKYNIKGISTSKMALDGYKMMQQYSKIVGKPKTILSSFMNTFNNNDNSPIKLVWADKSVSAESSTINGEELVLDYETGKYMLINEDRKEEMIENITIPINDISTYIKALLDLKACFKRNLNNTIPDYVNGYDVEYSKGIGYIENKNLVTSLNAQKKSFMDIAMLVFNKNDNAEYENVADSYITSNLYKLSCYVYTLKESFEVLSKAINNKEKFKDNKTDFYPIDLLKMWISMISMNVFDNLEDYSGIGKLMKNLKRRENLINDYYNIANALKSVEGYKEAYEFKNSYCYFKIFDVYELKNNTPSYLISAEWLLPQIKEEADPTDSESVIKINSEEEIKKVIMFNNAGSKISDFGNLEAELRKDTSIMEKILNDKGDDKTLFKDNAYKINNYFMGKKQETPLEKIEKYSFNGNYKWDDILKNIKNSAKKIADNYIIKDKRINNNTLNSFNDLAVLPLLDAVREFSNKYSYDIINYRECINNYKALINSLNVSMIENSFAKYCIYDLNCADGYMEIIKGTVISFVGGKYIYNISNKPFIKTLLENDVIKVFNGNTEQDSTEVISIHLKFKNSNNKEDKIKNALNEKEIISYINNFFNFIFAFLVESTKYNNDTVRRIDFYNDIKINIDEKGNTDINIGSKTGIKLLEKYYNNENIEDFIKEYCNFIKLQIENTLSNYEATVLNGKSLKIAKQAIKDFDNNKENKIMDAETYADLGLDSDNFLEQIKGIENSINNKKNIEPKFKKFAVKELKGENNKKSREEIEKNNESSFEEFDSRILQGAFETKIYDIDVLLNNIDKKVEELNTTLQNLNKKLIKVNNSNVGKEIELSLGSQESANSENHLTKSLSSLLNDFCSQCQPKISELEKNARGLKENGEAIKEIVNGKETEKEVIVKKSTMTDQETGEEKEIDTHNNIPRYNLTWGVVGRYKGSNKDVPIIGLYYKEPIKVSKLRKYNWGPGNAKMHCIKNLSISNGSEFALMHDFSTATIGADNNMLISVTNGNTVSETTTSEEDLRAPCFFNKVFNADRDKNTFNNLVNSVSQGNITLLGDPSLRFGGVVQPYTYPIYLNINLDRENSSWFYNKEKNKNEYYNDISQLSGYYVITKITHNISSSGFTTTIEVMKYPGSNKIIR